MKAGEGYLKDKVLLHGDFCLPNILYDGKAFGFIDLGDMGRGDPWLDYAWCLWSLDYNLKTSRYRKLMLEKLGIDFDEARYLRYITSYGATSEKK